MAVWVVSYHVSPGGLGPFRVTSFGYLAVDVFFAMSGYVLLISHGREEFGRLNWQAALRFLQLRWWRTYPLYAASILLSLAAFLLLHRAFPEPQHLLASALLLEVWLAPGIGMNTPVWSLGVEWLGYLAFPVVAWCCFRLSARLAAAMAIFAVFAEITVLNLLGHGLGVNAGLGAIARMAGGFATGCILATFGQPRTTPLRNNDAALAIVAAGLVATLLLVQDTFSLPWLMAGVWLVAWPGPITAAMLGSRVPLFLGRISFALYLCHWPITAVIHAWQSPGNRLVGLAYSIAAGTISLAVAYVLCRVIEEPTRRFGRRAVLMRSRRPLAPGGV